ncbi:MAG: DUF805 domain-containing protein [Bacillota bacterium]
MKDLFSWQGRVGRLQYFGIHVIFSVIIGVIAGIATAVGDNAVLSLIVGLLYVVYAYVSVVTTIKRFHDLDRPGVHYFFLFIPFYNIYLSLVLLFKKGTEGPNTFG